MSDGRSKDGSVVGFAPLGAFDSRAKFPGWDVREFEETMGPPPTPDRVKRRRLYTGLVVVAALAGVSLLVGGDDDSEQPPASVTPTAPTTLAPAPQEGFAGVGNTLAPVVRSTAPETVVVTLMPPPGA
ncbi:MAG: hypothetical protein KIH63_005540 [Candidatus Saccharibacteria bacterium]|nr:hypothetical protein [Candidatus Saccharibacteria bacterium]